jgi:hypothetical protein
VAANTAPPGEEEEEEWSILGVINWCFDCKITLWL